MDVKELLAQVTDNMAVSKVFGDPIPQGDALVVPVAQVRGGAGGGEGDSEQGKGSGGGGSFSARPAGVYVIRDGTASWQPAVDVTRIVLGGQLVAIVVALVVRSALRPRHRCRTPRVTGLRPQRR
ncbi:MAG TPA: spore germination protein GerW family protein [Intrasporangium sp.]|uniref:spore germination protein GerW family protein n=1 Tax=Intrasporangium sp. TaxID=1925024 RepID=UPI002D77F23F|nr:spore germination protein GerW family protein [Intrasporangium sp.]HET7397022.1 spore germination protein GerW family protein [Intrasporangium sp.]